MGYFAEALRAGAQAQHEETEDYLILNFPDDNHEDIDRFAIDIVYKYVAAKEIKKPVLAINGQKVVLYGQHSGWIQGVFRGKFGGERISEAYLLKTSNPKEVEDAFKKLFT